MLLNSLFVYDLTISTRVPVTSITYYVQTQLRLSVANFVPWRSGLDLRPRGICGRQSGSGILFYRILRFSLVIIIPPLFCHPRYIIQRLTVVT